MCNNQKIVWANALLSDGEILFWYIGGRCNSLHDFYKDFYYSNINMDDYARNHKLEVARIGFIDETDENFYSNLCFEVLAKDFFRQYKISPDSCGSPPYDL